MDEHRVSRLWGTFQKGDRVREKDREQEMEVLWPEGLNKHPRAVVCAWIENGKQSAGEFLAEDLVLVQRIE